MCWLLYILFIFLHLSVYSDNSTFASSTLCFGFEIFMTQRTFEIQDILNVRVASNLGGSSRKNLLLIYQNGRFLQCIQRTETTATYDMEIENREAFTRIY